MSLRVSDLSAQVADVDESTRTGQESLVQVRATVRALDDEIETLERRLQQLRVDRTHVILSYMI